MKRGEHLKPLADALYAVARKCDDDALASRLGGAALWLESEPSSELFSTNDNTRLGIALAEQLWTGVIDG